MKKDKMYLIVGSTFLVIVFLVFSGIKPFFKKDPTKTRVEENKQTKYSNIKMTTDGRPILDNTIKKEPSPQDYESINFNETQNTQQVIEEKSIIQDDIIKNSRLKNDVSENYIMNSNYSDVIEAEENDANYSETISTQNNIASFEFNDIKERYLVSIGNIALMDDYQLVIDSYSEYLSKDSSSNDTLFFNGGNGEYGSFLTTIEISNDSYMNRISFSQWDMNSPVTMNLGPIQVGDNITELLSIYGEWDNEEINYDVKQIIYNYLSYQGYPIKIIIYADSQTDLIYGYEISLK